MVGVPGRSRGCATCRKRKRGCDRAWPSCGQCQNAGVECGGYEKKHIFLVSTAESVQGSAKLNTTFYSKDRGENKPIKIKPYQPRTTQPSLELLSNKLARSAFEENAVGEFWDCYLPNARSALSRIVQYSSTGWVAVAQDLFQGNRVLRRAVLTNAVGLWAREKNVPQMLPSCQQMYGQTLRSVASYIGNTNEQQDLASIILVGSMLCLYECTYAPGCELFSSKQMEKYFAHVFGFEALMMSKDPSFYAQGILHYIFCDTRFQQITLQLQLRKRAPFAEKKWTTLPWMYIPKTTKDILIDIMADLCCVIEKSDSIALQGSTSEQASQKKEVVLECWRLHQEMQKWTAGLGYPAIHYLNRAKAGSGTRVEPTAEDCAISEMSLLYCATCIILYECLRANSDKSDVADWPEETNPRLYCHKIGSFLEFFMAFEQGRKIIQMVIFAVLTGLQFITRQEALGDNLVEERMALFMSLGDLRGVILGAVDGVDQASTTHHVKELSASKQMT
uniref:Zn(2)-C6 fungal-type domain-containing protein n=1 Tax=Bionectria ochroleuca TaxID=29856 RepID=A0A8H7TLU0_BIOOC